MYKKLRVISQTLLLYLLPIVQTPNPLTQGEKEEHSLQKGGVP